MRSLGVSIKLFLAERGFYKEFPIVEHRKLFTCPRCESLTIDFEPKPAPYHFVCSQPGCKCICIVTPRKRGHGK